MAHIPLKLANYHGARQLGKKSPAITVSQLRLILKIVLPLRLFDVEMTLSLVAWIQFRNHRAYLSHRRKKLAKMNIKT